MATSSLSRRPGGAGARFRDSEGNLLGVGQVIR
jgi:hypothetical protein